MDSQPELHFSLALPRAQWEEPGVARGCVFLCENWSLADVSNQVTILCLREQTLFWSVSFCVYGLGGRCRDPSIKMISRRAINGGKNQLCLDSRYPEVPDIPLIRTLPFLCLPKKIYSPWLLFKALRSVGPTQKPQPQLTPWSHRCPLSYLSILIPLSCLSWLFSPASKAPHFPPLILSPPNRASSYCSRTRRLIPVAFFFLKIFHFRLSLLMSPLSLPYLEHSKRGFLGVCLVSFSRL